MEFTFVSIAATKPSTPNPFDVTLLILSGIEIHLSSHFIVPNTHFIVLRTLAMETADGGAVGIVKDDNSWQVPGGIVGSSVVCSLPAGRLVGAGVDTLVPVVELCDGGVVGIPDGYREREVNGGVEDTSLVNRPQCVAFDVPLEPEGQPITVVKEGTPYVLWSKLDAHCPVSKFSQCTALGIPCFVLPNPKFKPLKCTHCNERDLTCDFFPPLHGAPPIKLPKNCVECQMAHQKCLAGQSPNKCHRCFTTNLVCRFIPNGQGARTDLKQHLFPKKNE